VGVGDKDRVEGLENPFGQVVELAAVKEDRPSEGRTFR